MNTCSVVGCASLKYPTSLLLIEISLYSTAGKWKRGSISIYLSSIVTDEDKTRYVSFYLLLANSMTAFNNQQYRRFPSIFRDWIWSRKAAVNWFYVCSRNSESESYCRIRPSTRLTPASLNSGYYTTGNSCPSTRLTTASLKPDNIQKPPSTRLTTLLVSNRGPILLETCVCRLDLLLLVWKRTKSETTVSQSETTVD